MATVDCTQCHVTSAWTGGNAKLAEVHKGKCNLCHDSANAIVSNFVYSNTGKVNTVYACEVCHVTGGAQVKETAHQPEHLATLSATGMTCSSCHTFNLTAGTVSDVKAVHSKGCVTCHGASTRADVKQFITSRVGLVSASYTCEDCHGAIHAGWDTKHQPSFPAVQNLNCSSCHQNYLPDEHKKAITATANTAIGYEVFRSAASAGPWTSVGTTTVTGWKDGGLAPATTYYYQVRAYDGKPNYSAKSATFSLTTGSATASSVTNNPDWAKYASGVNGDIAADPSSTTDSLNYLTDNSTRTYRTVRENGTSDQFIMVRGPKDASAYSKVQLKLNVRYYNGTNLTIYPYTTETAIDTANLVDGPSRNSSSSFTIETIDVTNAAKAMNGLGWMKFRIKPDSARSASVYIANAQIVLTQSAATGGSVTNPGVTVQYPTVPIKLTSLQLPGIQSRIAMAM